jgi:hypothetical protein
MRDSHSDVTSVILSGVASSRSEAATQSKDPYKQLEPCGDNQEKDAHAELIGVLRLRMSVRKRTDMLRSG